MRGLALLEGERVHRVVRPSRLGRPLAYGPGLALLAYAGALALVLGGTGGRAFAAGLDAAAGPLAVTLLLVLWWLGLALCTAPIALRQARALPLAYGVGVAVAGGLAVILLTLPDPSAPEAAALLPWVTLLAAPAPLAMAETQRGSLAWVLTNLRIAQRAGLLRPREESWRWSRLDRSSIALRRPEVLDVGDLVLAGPGGEVRLAGVRPLRALRAEAEMLLHTAPEAPYLGEQREAADKVARLLRPGEGR